MMAHRRRMLSSGLYRPTVLELQGNTTQATMPTPNNPVPLVDVGDLVTDTESPYYGKYAIYAALGGETTACYLDEPLRSVDFVERVDLYPKITPRTVWDFIEVSGNTVTLYRRIYKLIARGTQGWWVNTNGALWQYGDCGFALTHATYVSNHGICTHFDLSDRESLIYPNRNTKNTFGFNSAGDVTIVDVLRTTIGATPENSQSECLALFKAWLEDWYTNGNPVTVYVARTTPITTDLTDTGFGQKLLWFRRNSSGSAIVSNAIINIREA